MSHIDTSPAALKALADEALCNTAFVPKSLLRAIAAEKEAQASQEPVGEWVDYDDGFGPRLKWLQGYAVAVGDKLYLAPQHHPEQPLEMVAPTDAIRPGYLRESDYWAGNAIQQRALALAYAKAAVAQPSPTDVPLPEPMFYSGTKPVAYTKEQMHQYAEAYAKAAVAAERERCAKIAEARDSEGSLWNRPGI